MDLLNSPLYREELRAAAEFRLPWERLRGKRILISGATGLLGSFLVDTLLWQNREAGLNCAVYALVRDRARAEARFRSWGAYAPRILAQDVSQPIRGLDGADFVLHLASNTHPRLYAADPIGTIRTNLLGTLSLLDFAAACGAERCAFASSNEIYGENRGDAETFDEHYCGYIDCNTLRAGYPESKRCGEALCQAYLRQKELDIVIPRFTRSYGPTLLPGDSKAMSQFLHRAAAGEDIVLKSAGRQFYSFTYAADAVSGFLTVLLLGERGEAYNIADPASDATLGDLAALIADAAGTRVVYEVPDETERAGYSAATKARLNPEKLQALGWRARYDLPTGVARTLAIWKEAE